MNTTAADLFANQLKNNPRVEVSGMYYIDAVGYAQSSSPGLYSYNELLGYANAPNINPEVIASNVKHFGMFFQRNPFVVPWVGATGINRYTLTGSTSVQFTNEAFGVNHSTIATNANVQTTIMQAAEMAY